MSDNVKEQELASLLERVHILEEEISRDRTEDDWEPHSFYWNYYATTGFLLGGVAAAVSLLANMIGAPVAGKDPLELIRIFLTFPLGDKALQLMQGGKIFVVSDGLILAMGCCLYLGTGMVLGVLLFPLMMYLSRKGGLALRLVVGSVLAVGLWLVNFYVILRWLQPLLFGGNWITDSQLLPWWVAAVTHLLFGWALALLAPLGEFRPSRRQAAE